MQGSTLDLSCIDVNKLHSRVEFYNQDRQIQGYCTLPFPEPQCYSFNRRTHLIQNKNVTKLTVIGIDSKINGLWSCHHGTNIDESVNIYVVDVQGIFEFIFHWLFVWWCLMPLSTIFQLPYDHGQDGPNIFIDLPSIIGKLYCVIKKLHRLPIVSGSQLQIKIVHMSLWWEPIVVPLFSLTYSFIRMK